jgi:peptidoglycan L-alanyl-D-glutamate endopeptidase CwlK
MDPLSLQRIELLHPAIRAAARQILAEITAALTGRAAVRFTYTLRTAAEQNALYALGRTVKNPDGAGKQRPLGYKVTNAPAWASMHNYGLAVDIALILDGKTASWNDLPDYDGDKVSDWMECVKIFKAHGWVWGGNWSGLIDKPHFQNTFGFTLKQLQTKHDTGDMILGTPYANLGKPMLKGLITTADVNMRAGPGTTFSIIGMIPKGSLVIKTEALTNWTKIEFGKLNGWISNQHLK